MSMINKTIYRQLIEKQKVLLEKEEIWIKRELLNDILKDIKDNRILIISGIRRCGKSTLLKQIINKIKLEKENYCYINFEDEKFIDFKAQDFEEINELLIEIYGKSKYYLFDEIQNIDKFELFVRRLQDEGKKLIITGSNSDLLSKEFGTRLSGRNKIFELYPFSFKEFLEYKQYKNIENNYNIEKNVELKRLFKEYTINGGMPEYLKNKDENYIRTVYENILYKDVIARYSIKRQKTLKELVNILATSTTSLFTYNSLKEVLKLSNAITVKEYIHYISNTYLFFELLRFDFSIRKQFNFARKVYIIDQSFFNILGFNFSENKGKILENVVFIELKRKGKDIFYFGGKNECDFVIRESGKVSELIQICYELNEKNILREKNGLLEAMKTLGLNKGIILTFEQEEEIKEGKFKISIIPIWKWLLQR